MPEVGRATRKTENDLAFQHLSHTFDKLVLAAAEFPRYIDNRGGARSGKTIAELQLASMLAMNDTRPTITTVASDTLPHL